MFKFSLLTSTLFGVTGFAGLWLALPARANIFSHVELPKDRVVAVAAPYNEGRHQLLVIQQIADDQQCWRESSSAAGWTQVDPLLVYFDFTGICGRSTDSNGYSIRLGDRDLGWRYGLQVVKDGDEMLLMGIPTGNKNAPQLTIGRVGGWDEGFVKIHLNSGWRMTQRTYQGNPLGHIYFAHDQPLSAFKPVEQPAELAKTQSPPSLAKTIRQPYGVVVDVERASSHVVVPVGE